MLMIRETSLAGRENQKSGGDAMMFEAVSGGRREGFCVFTLRDGAVLVEDASCQDAEILDGLTRAGLSAAWQRGCKRFGFSDGMEAALRERLTGIGIPAEGELEAFFGRGCRG